MVSKAQLAQLGALGLINPASASAAAAQLGVSPSKLSKLVAKAGSKTITGPGPKPTFDGDIVTSPPAKKGKIPLPVKPFGKPFSPGFKTPPQNPAQAVAQSNVDKIAALLANPNLTKQEFKQLSKTLKVLVKLEAKLAKIDSKVAKAELKKQQKIQEAISKQEGKSAQAAFNLQKQELQTAAQIAASDSLAFDASAFGALLPTPLSAGLITIPGENGIIASELASDSVFLGLTNAQLLGLGGAAALLTLFLVNRAKKKKKKKKGAK